MTRRTRRRGRTLPVVRVRPSEMLTEALDSVLQAPRRSVLTMLGTVLGIGSAVAVLGLSATASGQITDDFTVVQATQVTVREDPPPVTASMPFPADTTARLLAVDGVEAAGTWWKVPLPDQSTVRTGTGAPVPTEVFAVSPGALDAAEVALATGRTYDAFAEDSAADVALLSSALADRLGIGDVTFAPAVVVGDQAYTVVGVLAGTGRLPQLATGMVVPTRTALHRYGDPSPEAPATVLVRTEVGAAAVVAAQAGVALRPDAPGLLVAAPPAEPDGLRGAVVASVDSFVLVLAVLAVAVGAVGIVNTTLVSVVERTGEIGLRRALGARPVHVAGQLVLEATALGALGGLVGSALALAAVVTVSVLQGWTPLLDPALVACAPAGGALVGALASAYPAVRAARLPPVAALRH